MPFQADSQYCKSNSGLIGGRTRYPNARFQKERTSWDGMYGVQGIRLHTEGVRLCSKGTWPETLDGENENDQENVLASGLVGKSN